MNQYNYPTVIYSGENSTHSLGEYLKKSNHQKAMIVTDQQLVKLGIVKTLVEDLNFEDQDYVVYDGVHPNPIEDDVKNGVDFYQNNSCDYLIALGGGSPMDVAKVIKIMLKHPWPMEQYDDSIGGDNLITESMPGLYAIPTTAGTGSEVGRAGVIILKKSQRKTIFFHPDLIPKIAVLDPKYSMNLPRSITVATGVDALVHCMEAFLSPGFHPMADGIALEGIQLILQNLPKVFEDGHDLDARNKMLVAAMMGATAFQKGLGMVHSLAHPLSSQFNLHHGLANALMLIEALKFIDQSVMQGESDERKKLQRLEEVIKSSLDQKTSSKSLADILSDFMNDLEVEPGLSHHGITENDLDKLSEEAFMDGCHQTNIIPIQQDDLRLVYRKAL